MPLVLPLPHPPRRSYPAPRLLLPPRPQHPQAPTVALPLPAAELADSSRPWPAAELPPRLLAWPATDHTAALRASKPPPGQPWGSPACCCLLARPRALSLGRPRNSPPHVELAWTHRPEPAMDAPPPEPTPLALDALRPEPASPGHGRAAAPSPLPARLVMGASPPLLFFPSSVPAPPLTTGSKGGAGTGGCSAGVRKKKGEGVLVQEDIAAVRTDLRMTF
jgi:hypothetical protein